jgi:hypothetical protein
LSLPWVISPDHLAPLDADIVRLISGVLTDTMTDWLLGSRNFSVRHRVTELMAKHSTTQFSDLAKLDPGRRRALAESMIWVEVEASNPTLHMELLSRSVEIIRVSGLKIPGGGKFVPIPAASAAPSPGPGVAVVGQRGRRYVKPTRREREVRCG